MRFALFAAASTLLVGFATLACSGSTSESSTDAADAGSSTGSATTTTTTTTTTTSTATSDAGTADAATFDAATTNGDAGAACGASSVHETESNDTTANTVPGATGSFCGRLTAGDVDKVSFTMPTSGVSTFGARIGSALANTNFRMTVTADVDGKSFNFFGRWPFVAGGVYTFTLSADLADDTGEVDYDLDFTFN